MGRSGFPSMKARQLKAALIRFGYVEEPDSGPGSHCWLHHPNHRKIRWAFHDKVEVSGVVIKRLLVT